MQSRRDDGGGRAIVWVLDDSALEAELVAEALRGRYAVETFTGATAMLERLAIAAPSPDLLIVDWFMPDLAGPTSAASFAAR